MHTPGQTRIVIRLAIVRAHLPGLSGPDIARVEWVERLRELVRLLTKLLPVDWRVLLQRH